MNAKLLSLKAASALSVLMLWSCDFGSTSFNNSESEELSLDDYITETLAIIEDFKDPSGQPFRDRDVPGLKRFQWTNPVVFAETKQNGESNVAVLNWQEDFTPKGFTLKTETNGNYLQKTYEAGQLNLEAFEGFTDLARPKSGAEALQKDIKNVRAHLLIPQKSQTRDYANVLGLMIHESYHVVDTTQRDPSSTGINYTQQEKDIDYFDILKQDDIGRLLGAYIKTTFKIMSEFMINKNFKRDDIANLKAIIGEFKEKAPNFWSAYKYYEYMEGLANYTDLQVRMDRNWYSVENMLVFQASLGLSSYYRTGASGFFVMVHSDDKQLKWDPRPEHYERIGIWERLLAEVIPNAQDVPADINQKAHEGSAWQTEVCNIGSYLGTDICSDESNTVVTYSRKELPLPPTQNYCMRDGICIGGQGSIFNMVCPEPTQNSCFESENQGVCLQSGLVMMSDSIDEKCLQHSIYLKPQDEPSLLPTEQYLQQLNNAEDKEDFFAPTVKLMSADGNPVCSGTLVSSDGLILTAGHCLPDLGAESIAEINNDGIARSTELVADFRDRRRPNPNSDLCQSLEKKIETIDELRKFHDLCMGFEGADFAILKLTEVARGIPFAKICSRPPAVGEEVFTANYPGGNRQFSKGQVIDYRTYNLYGAQGIAATAYIGPGGSGGALFNTDGELCGLTNAEVYKEEIVLAGIKTGEFDLSAAGAGASTSLPYLFNAYRSLKSLL